MYISNVNTSSIDLKSIEEIVIPVDQEYTINSNEQSVIFFINKGAAVTTVNNLDHEIKKWDIILLNPNKEITLKPIRRIEAIRIDIFGILFTSSLAINSNEYFFTIHDHHNIIKRYLDLLIFENQHPFRGTDIVLRRLIEGMMVHILRNKELSIKDASTQTKSDEIEQVQTYIKEHYGEKITLDRLSEIVNINKYYLIRLFKQKTGLSPIDYLIHVRLAEAEKLLVNTDITISKISDIVGFHSPSHFSKTFRESNHMTPSAYRKKHKKFLDKT